MWYLRVLKEQKSNLDDLNISWNDVSLGKVDKIYLENLIKTYIYWNLFNI